LSGRQTINAGLFILFIVGVIIWAAVASKPSPNFSGWFLDVGQGDAAYFRFPDGEDALIDGGGGKKVLSELGEVMPFYDKEINVVVLTHNHSDHLAGLIDVLRRYQVDEVWLSGALHTSDDYLTFIKILKDKSLKPKIVQAGWRKNFGAVEAEVVFPLEGWQGKRPENQHEADVVTRWSYGKFRVLMTGDLGQSEEEKILSANEPIQATILKVPHHGSATGLLPIFLSSVNPEKAVISVGRKNQFGHPSSLILGMLERAKIQIYRTDDDGRIGFTSDGQTYQIINP